MYDSSVAKVTLWVTSITAALLPIIPIVILVLSVQSKPARLGVIAAFNVLVSVCLTYFTDGTRKDVFSVTAA